MSYSSNYNREHLHHKLHRHAKHHVHRLKNSSDTHRNVFAFSFAISITFFVFVLWYFLSLPKILDAYRINKSEAQRLNDNPIDKFKNILTGKNPEIKDGINIEITQ